MGGVAITSDRERIAKIITIEQGKPFHEALGEVDYATSYINWYAQQALLEQGSILPFSQSTDTMLVTKEPIGVCAAITPWNFLTPAVKSVQLKLGDFNYAA